MALTTLSTDLNIIAKLDNYPPDDAGMTPARLKAKFDEGPNAVKAYLNETLLPELDAAVAALTAANLVFSGAYDPETIYPFRSVITYGGGSYITLQAVTGVTPADDGVYYQQLAAKGGTGDAGNGIASVARTSGDGSPGTADTYTITYTDASTETFTVYNGADGGLALGETSATAYRGDRGKTAYDHSQVTSGNPHSVTAAQAGAAAASHTHGASDVTAGTLGGQTVASAAAAATLTTAQVRNIYAGTTDMTAGSTPLATGDLYCMYE